MSAQTPVSAIKGFDKDLRCRGFQYEIGKTAEHKGPVIPCNSGFHACQDYPLDVFEYVPPAGARYAYVELSGEIKYQGNKACASHLLVKAEISIADLVKASIKFVMDRTVPAGSNHATGDQSASTATGDRSASTATGDQSASTATGYQSASTATGDQSASTATGYRSASTATGDRSASTATGYQSASMTVSPYSSSKVSGDDKTKAGVAVALGVQSKAYATAGNWLVIAERDDDGNIKTILTSLVGEGGLTPETWYMAQDGKFVAVSS